MASWIDSLDDDDELFLDRVADPGRDPDDFELTIVLARIAGITARRNQPTPDEPKGGATDGSES